MSASMKSTIVFSCMGILLLVATSTSAAVYVWTDGGADSNWSNDLNWGGTSLTQPGNWLHDLQFDLAGGGTSVADVHHYKLNSISFGAGAGAFIIEGPQNERIRIDNNITNNSTTLQTISAGVTIRPEGSTPPTINAAAGDILFDSTGGYRLHLYDKGMIIDGANNVEVDRVVSSNQVSATEVAIEKNGTGNLTLTGNNTFNGTVEVNDGRIFMQHNNAFGNDAHETIVNDGGTIYLLGGAAAGDITENFTLNGLGYVDQGALRSGSAANYDVMGTVTLDSNTRIATDGGSQINISGIISGTGRLEKTGSGTVELTGGDNTYSGGTLISEGTLIAHQAPQLLGTGDIEVATDGTLIARWSTAIIPSQKITLSGGFIDMRANNDSNWDNDIDVTADSRIRVGNVANGNNRTHNFGTVTWLNDAAVQFNRQNNHLAVFDAFDVTGVYGTKTGGAPIEVGSITGLGMYFEEGATTITGPVNVTDFVIGHSGTTNATVNYDGGTNTLSADNIIVGDTGTTNNYTFNIDSGTVNTPNDLVLAQGSGTGRVNVFGGTLTVGGNVIESSTGDSTIEVNGGTLDMTGGTMTLDRLIYRSGSINNVAGATLTGQNGVDYALKLRGNVDLDFPIVLQDRMRWENNDDGTGVMSSTVDLDGGVREINVQNGSAGTDLRFTGAMSNGGIDKTGGGTMTWSAGTINVDSIQVSNGTFARTVNNEWNYSGDIIVDGGTMEVNLSPTKAMRLTGDGTITVLGGGTFHTGLGFFVNLDNDNTTGYDIDISGGNSDFIIDGWARLGQFNNKFAKLQQNNGIAEYGALVIGDAPGSNATYQLNNGTFIITNDNFSGGRNFMVGREGTGVLNIDGGKIITLAGTYNDHAGNSITVGKSNPLTIGYMAGGDGTVNHTNGPIIVDGIDICPDGVGTGTYNFSGGKIRTDSINVNTANGQFNWSGGTLHDSDDNGHNTLIVTIDGGTFRRLHTGGWQTNDGDWIVLGGGQLLVGEDLPNDRRRDVAFDGGSTLTIGTSGAVGDTTLVEAKKVRIGGSGAGIGTMYSGTIVCDIHQDQNNNGDPGFIIGNYNGGQGEFYQFGGTVITPKTVIGRGSGNTGFYRIEGGSLQTDTMTINDTGTFVWLDSATVKNDSPITVSGGGFERGTGTTWSPAASMTLSNETSSYAYVADPTTIGGSGSVTQNNGHVVINDLTVSSSYDLSGGLLETQNLNGIGQISFGTGGTLTAGTINGDFNHTSGTLDAGTPNVAAVTGPANDRRVTISGAALGETTITGDYSMGPNAVLAIDLDPSQPGGFPPSNNTPAIPSLSDKLVVDGALELGGTLDLRPVTTDWKNGVEFDILDFALSPENDADGDGELDSQFDWIIVPLLGEDGFATIAGNDLLPNPEGVGEGGDTILRWDFRDLYTTGLIRVIPEPATWAIFGIGLFGVGMFIRRRKSWK